MENFREGRNARPFFRGAARGKAAPRAVPALSPACGGEVERGHARHGIPIEPPPHPSPASGGGSERPCPPHAIRRDRSNTSNHNTTGEPQHAHPEKPASRKVLLALC